METNHVPDQPPTGPVPDLDRLPPPPLPARGEPPDGTPPRPHSPPPSGSIGRRALIVIAGAVIGSALLGGAVAWSSSAIDEWGQRIDAEEADSQDDAQLASCEVDPTGTVAVLAVTNDSSGHSTYVVDVAFADASGHREEGHAYLDAVPPGDTIEARVTGPDGALDCAVTHVERFAS